MAGYKFDAAKIARLDDPGRLEDLRPDVMWKALGRPRPAAIADVGAGTGMFSEQWALRAPSATIFALDVDQRMLDWIAEKRRGLVESGRVVPMLSGESALPLPDAVIDLVAFVNMHHELDDPAAMYREAARVLRPGGQLLVVDWADRETPKGPPLVARSSAEEIAGVLAGAGLAEVQAHGGLSYHSLLTALKPR